MLLRDWLCPSLAHCAQLLADPLTTQRLGLYHLGMLALAVWAAPLLAVPLLPLWHWDRQHRCAAFLTSHSLMVGVVLTSTLARVTYRAVGIYRSASGLPAGTPDRWRSLVGALQLQLAELLGWDDYLAGEAASGQPGAGQPPRRVARLTQQQRTRRRHKLARWQWVLRVDRVGQQVAALLVTWLISLLLSFPWPLTGLGP